MHHFGYGRENFTYSGRQGEVMGMAVMVCQARADDLTRECSGIGRAGARSEQFIERKA